MADPEHGPDPLSEGLDPPLENIINNCSVHYNFAACGSVVNNTTLTSPGYPNSYPGHMNCSWTLEIPTEKILNVTFELLDIAPSGNCG